MRVQSDGIPCDFDHFQATRGAGLDCQIGFSQAKFFGQLRTYCLISFSILGGSGDRYFDRASIMPDINNARRSYLFKAGLGTHSQPYAARKDGEDVGEWIAIDWIQTSLLTIPPVIVEIVGVGEALTAGTDVVVGAAVVVAVVSVVVVSGVGKGA